MNGTRNEWGETPPDAREIIFCVDGTDYRGYGFYFLFLHEADVMMLAAAGEVEGGRLKPAEARKVLEPYREVLAPLYTDEQRAVSDPDGRGWDEPDTFPTQEELWQSPQASRTFWREAAELGIEGVMLRKEGGAPTPRLAPMSQKALRKLIRALSDRYKIVIMKNLEEIGASVESVERASRAIQEARETPEEEPRTQLVYGSINDGLVFLEKNYARDIATFRRALGEARTWGELRSMVSAERYEETVDEWIESKIDNIMSENDLEDAEGIEVDPPKPDDAFDPDEISAYADSYWPEWAPDMMSRWLGHEIIERYGFLVETILDTSYPVIAHENEKQVVSLPEKQGYSCIRDDDLVWDAVW